jgi:hypothetical protein
MSLTSRFARRLGGLAAVAIAAAVGVPLAASASPSGHGVSARSAAATGVVYGGRTPQGWPVMVELTRNQRRVVLTVIGITLPCTSGQSFYASDFYDDLPVNRQRKFRESFGPNTQRNDDGTTSDWEGTMSGRLNRARSKMSGRWQLKVTHFDHSGAVTDTCSGSVRWTAKQ